MTTTHHSHEIMSKITHDHIVDQLRARNTAHEILEFERWFNKEVSMKPLYSIISDLLRDRSISRSTASKWFEALIRDRDTKLKDLN